MSVKKYRQKPKIVTAIEYDGSNLEAIYDFVGTNLIGLKGISILKVGDFVVKLEDGTFGNWSKETF